MRAADGRPGLGVAASALTSRGDGERGPVRAVRRCRFVLQARPVAGRPPAPANRRAGIAKAGGRRFGGGALLSGKTRLVAKRQPASRRAGPLSWG